MIPLRDHELGELTGVRIPGDRGADALASALTRQLARSVDKLPAPEAARLGTAVVDVLAVALAGCLDRASAVPEARERALLHRIFASSSSSSPTPSSRRGIAAAHHISLRYLYKLFEAEPVTVGGWVRRRRLQRCRQDLRDPEQRYRPVAAIGARWGFVSAAHSTVRSVTSTGSRQRSSGRVRRCWPTTRRWPARRPPCARTESLTLPPPQPPDLDRLLPAMREHGIEFLAPPPAQQD